MADNQLYIFLCFSAAPLVAIHYLRKLYKYQFSK